MNPGYIVFTDGSVRRWTDPSGKSMDAGSYGVVALDLSTMKYTKFGGRLNCKSAAYAEASSGEVFSISMAYACGVKKNHPYWS